MQKGRLGAGQKTANQQPSCSHTAQRRNLVVPGNGVFGAGDTALPSRYKIGPLLITSCQLPCSEPPSLSWIITIAPYWDSGFRLPPCLLQPPYWSSARARGILLKCKTLLKTQVAFHGTQGKAKVLTMHRALPSAPFSPLCPPTFLSAYWLLPHWPPCSFSNLVQSRCTCSRCLPGMLFPTHSRALLVWILICSGFWLEHHMAGSGGLSLRILSGGST